MEQITISVSLCEKSERGGLLKMGIQNFTHLYRARICCDSVTLWTINGLISVALQPIGQKFLLRPFGQKRMSQKIFYRARAGSGQGRGQKTSDLSSYLRHFKLMPKIEKNKTGMDRFQDCCKAYATNA